MKKIFWNDFLIFQSATTQYDKTTAMIYHNIHNCAFKTSFI